MTMVTETRAPLDVATEFMAALDANDSDWVARCFAPGGTWWVDTGFDRAAGDFYTDPGADRPWPLHGVMDAAEKTALLAGLPDRFPGGCRQTLTRSFAGGNVAVLEVDGDGWFLGERHYANRYCFLVEVRDGLVWAVREYLDTAHSAHVFDGRNLDRHTEGPEPTTDVLAGRDDLTGAEKVARTFLSALNNASPEDLFEVCTPDASWWQDGGRIRTGGPAGPIAEDGGDFVLVGRVPIRLRGVGIATFKETYPDGFAVRAHRVTADDNFADSGLVAIEATSHGRRPLGLYQNRYVFVLKVEGGLISEVREYCDTRHAFDVYGLHDRL